MSGETTPEGQPMRIPALCLALFAAAVSAHADETAGTPPPAAAAPGMAAPAAAPPPASAPATTGAATTGSSANGEPAPAPHIYLVARVKLNGTDLTQVIFFQSDAITTLEDCETERTAGMTTGWTHYSARYVNTLPGVSYKIDYRCVQSDQHLAFWHRANPMSTVYLVHTQGGKLGLQVFSNFFRCRDSLRNEAGKTREESIDLFCATSSQSVIVDSVDTTGGDDNEADGDAAPPPSPAH
jgi:hypothetical protein